jgi:hypothetical protein
MSSLKSTLIKSFSEANGCDPENVKNFAKIYLTPTVSSDASLLVVKDTSTDASGNATYQYIISPSDSSMQTKNGESFVEIDKNYLSLAEYLASFSYSAIISYNFDTFEEMCSHPIRTDSYCRFPHKSIGGSPNFLGYYDYGDAIKVLASEWNENNEDKDYDYGDFAAAYTALHTGNDVTYFTDSFRNSYASLGVSFDFYIICDDPSVSPGYIKLSCTNSSDSSVFILPQNDYSFNKITSTERITSKIGKNGQYYSKHTIKLDNIFTTYNLYDKIIDDSKTDEFGEIRNTAVRNFYDFAFGTTNFKISNYICSDYCAEEINTHDIEKSIPDKDDGRKGDWVTTNWTFYRCPDVSSYRENYSGNSDIIYYNGNSGTMSYGDFLPGASYSEYKDFYNSNSYESALNAALLPILIKGEEVEEPSDDEDFEEFLKYSGEIGLHMFNSTFLLNNIIHVDVYTTNFNVFSNVYFYIDNVKFYKSENPKIIPVKLYGSRKSYYASSIGYVSDINTYNCLSDLCTYYGLNTSFVDSSINITPTTENFNAGLLGYQETINPYVQFNITSVEPPKVSYIKNSLMIDGFDINDFNGYINNVLDSRYHDICVKFKNEDIADIVVTPELFNVVYTYKDGIHQGNFMNLYDEYARDPNNQVSVSDGILQFPMKTYTTYISSEDSSILYDYVLIKLNSENFSGESSLYEPENDVSIFAQIEPPRRVMPHIKIMTDTGSYAAERVTDYYDNNGREYWIIPAGATAEIHYNIDKNKSTAARLFGVGLTMMFKQAISYEYAKQYIITFNDRKMKDSDDNDVNLPIFIQTVNMTNTQEAKYLTTNNLDESDNVINIGEEITNSDDNADNMIIDIRNCEIIMVPHRFTAPNDSNMSNPEDSNPANERCLTANNLIINLPATAHSQYGYYKYVEHDNEYAAKWKAITTTIITPTIDV